MRTFDAILGTGCFWAAVFVPPMVYFGLVQWWGGAADGGTVSVGGLIALVGLAHAFPLSALAWTLCSRAAYSVGEGRFVVHRVVGDRAFSLAQLHEPPQLANGVISLRVDGRRFRLRVAQPDACFEALCEAAAMAGHRVFGGGAVVDGRSGPPGGRPGL